MSDHDPAYEMIRVEVARLAIHPGDKLLIRFPSENIPHAELERLSAKLKEFFGPEIPCLMICGNIELSIIHREPGLFGRHEEP